MDLLLKNNESSSALMKIRGLTGVLTVRILILLVIVAAGLALGQTNLGVGSIGGSIRDESNAVVAGARVILTEESKGFVRDSESDSGELFCSHR